MKSFWQRLRYYQKAYKRLELMNKSASLSFYTIISIFPMVLILATILGSFFSEAIILEKVTDIIDEALPYQSQLVLTNLKSLIGKKIAFSWVGILALIVSAQMLYVNLERMINGILHTPRQRNFFISRLFFMLWLVSIVLSILLPVSLELLSHAITHLGWNISPLAKVSTRGGFFMVSTLIFVAIMYIMPTRRMLPKRVFLGSLVFAVALQTGKVVFKWITLHNLDRYNIVYGSLATMILGTLWIFYYYNILLFCVYWVGREHDPIYLDKKRLSPA